MKYYKLSGHGESRVCVETQGGVLADLTSIDEDVVDIDDLALAASLSGKTIDDVAAKLLGSGQPETYDLAQVVGESRTGEGELLLDRPFDPPEVWAAGVTYKSSEMERRRESTNPDVYSQVYSAERPELFLKASPERCSGPFEPVGIRGDSKWNVPEPELTFVLYRGVIIGYTVGNDMSSRSIEGENPLYLPQAKVYDRCCAIGPCLVTPNSICDPRSLTVRCSISRSNTEVFEGETSTSLMARSCDDLASWLQRHNVVLNMTAVLTGTAIVPPPDFTLHEGDVITISIDNIGTLENEVITV